METPFAREVQDHDRGETGTDQRAGNDGEAPTADDGDDDERTDGGPGVDPDDVRADEGVGGDPLEDRAGQGEGRPDAEPGERAGEPSVDDDVALDEGATAGEHREHLGEAHREGPEGEGGAGDRERESPGDRREDDRAAAEPEGEAEARQGEEHGVAVDPLRRAGVDGHSSLTFRFRTR